MLKHEVDKIEERTWRINEFGLVNAFAVEGDEYLAIIDTGCGYGDIRGALETVSDKPVKVLLTHKHPDHAGGIYHFHDCSIYMNKEDEGLTFLGMGLDNAFRRMYAETRGPVKCPGREEEILSMIPPSEPDCTFSYINTDDGTAIGLGSRTLTCIHTPGHTKGSVCYLDEKLGILFSGDAVNKSIILMRQPENSNALIEEFDGTLRKLWARKDDFEKLAIGHDGPFIDRNIISDYLVLTEGILNGSIAGDYEEKGFRKGEVARYGMAELWYRCDQ